MMTQGNSSFRDMQLFDLKTRMIDLEDELEEIKEIVALTVETLSDTVNACLQITNLLIENTGIQKESKLEFTRENIHSIIEKIRTQQGSA